MYNMHVRLKCHVLTSASLVMSCLHRETCAHYRNRVMIMYGIEADCDGRLNHGDVNVLSEANAAVFSEH